MKKLYRNEYNKMIGGICSGIADYFNLDPTLIRLLYVIITLFTGIFVGVFFYGFAYLILPVKRY